MRASTDALDLETVTDRHRPAPPTSPRLRLTVDALTLVLLIVGFVLLVAGAEVLVRGSSRLAVALGISPLVVGLTVVALGTSAPELAVTVQSSVADTPELAIGNVFGSNISNILLILGVSALVTPLVVDNRLIRRDVPVMIGVTALVLALVAVGDGLEPIDGVVLLALGVAYTTWIVIAGRRERSADYDVELGEPGTRAGSWWVNVGLVLVGLGALVIGSNWLVDGAVELAAALGLSELVIGLTVVAVGTSLPELATAVVATIRGERDIVAGNIVGSNILNLVLVLGAGALASSKGLPTPDQTIELDGPVMLAASLACLPVFFSYGGIRRWEGGVFVAYYAAYVTYLVLDATDQSSVRNSLGTALVLFVLPITVLTFAVVAWRELRIRRPTAEGTAARRASREPDISDITPGGRAE